MNDNGKLNEGDESCVLTARIMDGESTVPMPSLNFKGPGCRLREPFAAIARPLTELPG